MEPIPCDASNPCDTSNPSEATNLSVALLLTFALTLIGLVGSALRRREEPETREPARVVRPGDPRRLEDVLQWDRIRKLPYPSARVEVGIEFLALARTAQEEQDSLDVWDREGLLQEVPVLAELAERLSPAELWQRRSSRFFHGTNGHYARQIWREAACGAQGFDEEDRLRMRAMCERDEDKRSTYGLRRILEPTATIWASGQVRTSFEYMRVSPEWFDDLVGDNFHELDKGEGQHNFAGCVGDGFGPFFDKYWARFQGEALVILQRRELSDLPSDEMLLMAHRLGIKPNWNVDVGLDPSTLLPPHVYTVGREMRQACEKGWAV